MTAWAASLAAWGGGRGLRNQGPGACSERGCGGAWTAEQRALHPELRLQQDGSLGPTCVGSPLGVTSRLLSVLNSSLSFYRSGRIETNNEDKPVSSVVHCWF